MKDKITQNEVNQYQLLLPLLTATYNEIQELSKKKPESPLNPYKVKAINRILNPLKEILKNEDVFEFLDILDSDELPTNSDVILILSQYREAMDLFKKNYKWRKYVRSLTIRAINLVSENMSYQLDILNDYVKHEKLYDINSKPP